MIDFIRFRVEDKTELESFLIKSDLVDLKSTLNEKTGEISDYPKIGKFKNLEIRIYLDHAYIHGSIHKFYNSLRKKGNINYDDFDTIAILKTINYLCGLFSIDKEKTKVTNLEFGFNLNLNYKSRNIINANILMFDFESHDIRKKYKSTGVCKIFSKSDYCIKLYDKGAESKIPNQNILRIELKITTARKLMKLGINNLNQINEIALSRLYTELLKGFDKLLIIDSIKAPNCLETHDRVFYETYINPFKWSNNLKSYYEIKKDKLKLLKMIRKTKSNMIQTHIRELITKKYNYLNPSLQTQTST